MADEFSTKWFGDSKVVGKTGKPLVLYRGLTGSSTEGFPDAALAGEPRSGYATFLSDNAKVAGSYAAVSDPLGFQAGAIVPLYVKADEVIEFHNTRENEHGHFDMFEFDRQAKNLRPGQVLVARNVRDSGPHASLEADPDYGWQARSDTYAVGPGTEMRSAISKGITQEPRTTPPDQPNLPEVISSSSEEQDGRPKSKGRMVRGIGSLMRRRIFPLIQAAQMGYDLLPEDKKFVGDFIDYLKETKTHELFGMDKSVLDYLRGLFGMSPEDLGETIPLPGPPQETDKPPFSEVFLSRSTPEAMDIFPGPSYPGRIVYAINNERGDNIGFVDIDSIDNGVANISDIVVSGRNSLGHRNMRQLLDQLRQNHPEIKRISGERVSGARRGGAHGFAGTGEDVSVDLSSPRGASKSLPKAAGGLIDKPLYDDRRMIG